MRETVRTFIAVPIPQTPSLRRIANELRSLGGPVRVVDLHGLHLTLRFLGDTKWNRIAEIGEVIEEIVSQYHSFEATLDGIGTFPGVSRARVVWTGLRPAESLTEIARSLNDSLYARGFPGDRKKFVPHVTLARIKGKAPSELIDVVEENASRQFGEVAIDHVVYYQSELTQSGPIYTVLSEHELK